jgi:hypothetical protein
MLLLCTGTGYVSPRRGVICPFSPLSSLSEKAALPLIHTAALARWYKGRANEGTVLTVFHDACRFLREIISTTILRIMAFLKFAKTETVKTIPRFTLLLYHRAKAAV